MWLRSAEGVDRSALEATIWDDDAFLCLWCWPLATEAEGDAAGRTIGVPSSVITDRKFGAVAAESEMPNAARATKKKRTLHFATHRAEPKRTSGEEHNLPVIRCSKHKLPHLW